MRVDNLTLLCLHMKPVWAFDKVNTVLNITAYSKGYCIFI